MDEWISGSGAIYSFKDVLSSIEEHVEASGRVYVGTDSFINKNKCTFATAICLHGANNQKGGKYFFRRVNFEREKFPTLVQRITAEVQQTIEIGLTVVEHSPNADIELHMDISPPHTQEGTSRFADMLSGYAASTGLECKIKPHALASASVADKHSK